MHISSLPGPFGTGVIGQEAIEFAKQLASQGMKYWQVLPFSYPGMGNSPYQSFSAFAGNWLFIDPRRLEQRGLLTPAEVQQAEYTQNKWRIDFDFLRTNRDELLRKAFERADKDLLAKADKFIKDNKWVQDVAAYQTVKDADFGKPWWDWSEKGGKGLNLTFEVRDGILNHKLKLTPQTLEGQAVSISDRIAYLNHDVDDAVRAGVISEGDLPKSVLEVLGRTSRERINTMITSAYEESNLKNYVRLAPEVDKAMTEMRNFMFDTVYRMPVALREEERAGNMLSSMYEYFKKHPEKLPDVYKSLLDKFDLDTVVCDYLSGMTDRYAIRTFQQIFIPESF